jgi:hypothetical protein
MWDARREVPKVPLQLLEDRPDWLEAVNRLGPALRGEEGGGHADVGPDIEDDVTGPHLDPLLQVDPRHHDLFELVPELRRVGVFQEPLQVPCAHDWPARIPQIRVGPGPDTRSCQGRGERSVLISSTTVPRSS